MICHCSWGISAQAGEVCKAGSAGKRLCLYAESVLALAGLPSALRLTFAVTFLLSTSWLRPAPFTLAGLANVMLWLLPSYQVCPWVLTLLQGWPGTIRVLARTGPGCAQAQDPAGHAHGRICLWMQWDPPAESLGYILLSSRI